MKTLKWTSEEDAVLEASRKNGATWQEIADTINKQFGSGRSKGACRKRYSDYVEGDPEDLKAMQSLKKRLDEMTRERDRAMERVDKILDESNKRLQSQFIPEFTSKLQGRKASKRSGRRFNRLIVPDSHGCFADEPTVDAMLRDASMIPIHETVLLGDHLDCGGFLAQHHTNNFVAEMPYSFADDVAAANVFLNAVRKVVDDDSDMYYIEGNHERRIEKWCVTESCGSEKDARYLMGLNGPETVLSLEARGIQYIRQSQYYHDCKIPGTIKLGHCFFQHGTRTNKHAAAAMLDDFSANVVFGHTHRADEARKRTAREIIGAWNPGCLCRLQPLWRMTAPVRWNHGYAIQIVDEDSGRFLHINIPIIGGQSLMLNFLNDISGFDSAVDAS